MSPKSVIVDTAYAVSRSGARTMGASARIAEFPQIAIPTAMRLDNGCPTPIRRASHVVTTSPIETTATMASTLAPPVSRTWPTVSRAPSSVIPTRNANRAASRAPARRRARTGGKLPNASPSARESAVSSPGSSAVPASQAAAETRPQMSRPGTEARRTAAGSARRQSRTRGGLSRSNMWTVSTNRTCLVW